MNHTSRNVSTATRKRKDRVGIEDSSFFAPRGNFVNKQQYQHPNKNTISPTSHYFKNSAGSSRFISEPGLGQSNRVLAGYMAHEFLTKGTLLGQKFDPARAEAVPVSAAEPKRKPGMVELVGVKPSRSYADVAQLVKGVDGAHIPGIVNPTQLAKWI